MFSLNLINLVKKNSRAKSKNHKHKTPTMNDQQLQQDAANEPTSPVSVASSSAHSFASQSSIGSTPSETINDISPALAPFKISQVPNIYYIPEFLTPEEEAFLVSRIYAQPASKWVTLKNRRLQNHGGTVHEKGMFVEALPDWLQRFSKKILDNYNIFPKVQ